MRCELPNRYGYNTEKEPCLWPAGRIFTFGDGAGNANSPNWHRAIFSRRYLTLVMERAGLKNVHEMDRTHVRAADHGWINLGMAGEK